MAFVPASGPVGGNLDRRLGATQASPPLIDRFPPDQFQPFVHQGFRPLAMSPPSDAKLSFVPGGRYRVLMPRDFTPENAQRASRVEIRGHDQHPLPALPRQALLRILRLILGRHSIDGANTDR